MLKFFRRRDQKIVFTTAGGERVEVVVDKIRHRTVSLRCYAEPATSIHRGEVQARIDAEQGRSGFGPGGRAA